MLKQVWIFGGCILVALIVNIAAGELCGCSQRCRMVSYAGMSEVFLAAPNVTIFDLGIAEKPTSPSIQVVQQLGLKFSTLEQVYIALKMKTRDNKQLIGMFLSIRRVLRHVGEVVSIGGKFTYQSRPSPAIHHSQVFLGSVPRYKVANVDNDPEPWPIRLHNVLISSMGFIGQPLGLLNVDLLFVDLQSRLFGYLVHGVGLELHFLQSLLQGVAATVDGFAGKAVSATNLQPLKAGEPGVGKQHGKAAQFENVLAVLPPVLAIIGGWALGGWGLWRLRACNTGWQAGTAISSIAFGFVSACVGGIAIGLRFFMV